MAFRCLIKVLQNCYKVQDRDFTLLTLLLHQACIAADGSFVETEQHLQALKELCDTLSPEDAHRLAQTQLRECENRLAAIQRQFSGDQDAPVTESR